MVLTTISATLFIVVFLADLFGLHTNPYIGIVFFLALPAVFLAGLALIPLGAWIERRRRAAGKPPSSLQWPRIDLNDPAQRATALILFCLTIANIVIVSLAAYRGVEYMDSVAFCGQVCHAPMRPEFAAHETGPHARVACVECHVGPGATSFVSAKLVGTRRVLAVASGRYARPIVPSPGQLLSAAQTCETCHWPERFHGDKIRRVAEYADDEKNSESITTLHLHVGGGDVHRGTATGIHWHMNLANVIEYFATDRERQEIPYVRLTDREGGVREYYAGGTKPEQIDKSRLRRMDCMDCHNRPSHAIAATPERAVNEAMADGRIPRTVPFIHREGVKLLKASYSSQDAGTAEISRAMRTFYQSAASSPLAGDVDRATRGLQEILRRSLFPDMNVGFGTYKNNIGHIDSPGCFRCHDEEHQSTDGRKIDQDCESCHAIE